MGGQERSCAACTHPAGRSAPMGLEGWRALGKKPGSGLGGSSDPEGGNEWFGLMQETSTGSSQTICLFKWPPASYTLKTHSRHVCPSTTQDYPCRVIILHRASVSLPCTGTHASCALGTAEINANTQKALGALWKLKPTRMTMSSHATACQLSLRIPLHRQNLRKGNKADCCWGYSRGCGTVLLPSGWCSKDSQVETGQTEKAGGMLPSSEPLLSGYWLGDGVQCGP